MKMEKGLDVLDYYEGSGLTSYADEVDVGYKSRMIAGGFLGVCKNRDDFFHIGLGTWLILLGILCLLILVVILVCVMR